jgi:hypothetical protein
MVLVLRLAVVIVVVGERSNIPAGCRRRFVALAGIRILVIVALVEHSNPGWLRDCCGIFVERRRRR